MEDIETALLSFLLSDPFILELIQTKPEPPRAYPSVVPQGVPLDKLHLIYWVTSRTEPSALTEPSGFLSATIMLESRIQSQSPRLPRLLAKRIKDSTGPNPSGEKLHGFRGNWPNGYVVQKCWITNSRYRYERPVKSGEIGVHAILVELQVFWNDG